MPRFLALAALCAVGAAGTAVAALTIEFRDDVAELVPARAPRRPEPAPAAPPAPSASVRPGAPLRVSGRITSIAAEEGDAAPVQGPLTVDGPARGEAKATIVQATIGGKPVTIAWDGGRPLVLQGGQLEIGVARFTASAGAGLRWLLDGEPRRFTPGVWRTPTPVAVGDEGLARPREGVAFRAGESTLLQTKGGAFVTLPVATYELTGAGSVHIEGDVTVGGRRRKVVDIAAERYRFRLVPVKGGYDVTGEIVEPSR